MLNSLASTAVKVQLVARISRDRALTIRVAMALGVVMVLGFAGTFVPAAVIPTVAAGR